MKPSYLSLSESEMEGRVKVLREKLEDCDLCPLECGVDRLAGEAGVCGSGDKLLVSSVTPHFGEERPLVGSGGSGTVFLANCNLSCVYCQNYDISQLGRGEELSPGELADRMLRLQKRGCHNVNWVSPTHCVPQLVEALLEARKSGFELPVVYNTGGYDSLETLRILTGIVDIYMPDMKYSSDEMGRKYSKVPNYWKVNRKAVREMHRQVGELKLDESGVARKGLLIRHLVLPDGLAGSGEVLRFVAKEISSNTYVNIMDQYRPCAKASEYPELNRRIRMDEYEAVMERAGELNLVKGL